MSIAVLSAFAMASQAFAQSSVTLYGIIDTSIQYTHNTGGESNQIKMQAGQMSISQWGLKGTEDLGGGLSALFTLESGFDVNNGALSSSGVLFDRKAYVGLSHTSLGTVTLGCQMDVLQDLVVPVQGDNFLEFLTAPGDVDLSDGSVKVSNPVKWTSPVWGGLQVAAMYDFGKVAGATGSRQSYSAAVNYVTGPHTLAAGYIHADNGNPVFRRGAQAA
ncbi:MULTISPECIES: porin [unclassified Caballeronia]|uniref:porin n=1 Tax=unclassified Caballeronia TaxID=2646786 RepID=UPI002815B42C|nr:MULTISPECIES: porin [unclassified Caballeronia]